MAADPKLREQLLDQAQGDLEAAVREEPTLATAQAMLSFLYHDRKDEVSAVLTARKAYEADAYLRATRRYRVAAVIYASLSTAAGFGILWWRGLP